MLSRPIFTASVCAFFAALMAVSFSSRLTVPIIACCFILAAALLIFHRKITFGKHLAMILLTGAITAGYTLFVLMNTLAPIVKLDGQQVSATIRITGEPATVEDSVTIPVEFVSLAIVGAPSEFDGYLYCDTLHDFAMGDTVTGKVVFKAVSDYREDKYYSEGRYITAMLLDVSDVVHDEKRWSLIGTLSKIRTSVTDFFAKNLNATEAAFLSGLTMNDKSDFTDEMYNDFSRSGISHIVSVSGMHLCVLCAAIRALLQKFSVPNRLIAVILIPLVLLMILLVGAPYSAIRSGIMVIITLVGTLIFRKTDGLTSLGIAALLIISFQPLAVVSLSFQLSFAATLGLIVLARPLDSAILAHPTKWRWLNRVIGWLSPILAVSVSAALFTLPILALRFENVPIVAPLTNLCLLFTVSVALICALLSALFAPIQLISMPLLFVAGILSKYILAVAKFFGSLPFATWSFASAGMKLALAGAIILLAIVLLRDAKRRTVVLSLLLGLVILLGATFADVIHQQNTVTLRVFQSESGLSAVASRGKQAVLIGAGDSGSVYAADDYLRRLGIRRFDSVLLPDLDETFAKGWKTLIHSTEYDILLIQGDGKYSSVFASNMGDTLSDEIDRIEPFADVKIEMVHTEAGNGAVLHVFGTKVLIAKQNFDDVDADVLICTLPTQENIEQYSAVIIGGSGNKAAVSAARIQDKTEVYIVDETNLELRFGKAGNYTLRRTR